MISAAAEPVQAEPPAQLTVNELPDNRFEVRGADVAAAQRALRAGQLPTGTVTDEGGLRFNNGVRPRVMQVLEQMAPAREEAGNVAPGQDSQGAVAGGQAAGVSDASAAPDRVEGWVTAAVENRDVDLLRRLLGNTANTRSRKQFEELTGTRLPGSQRDTLAAVDAWAGVTPEQRAEQERAAARERQDAEERRRFDAASQQLDRLEVQGGGTLKSALDKLMADGYTELHPMKRGASTRYLLARPGDDSGMRLFGEGWPPAGQVKAYIEGALKARRDPAAASAAAQDAGTPDAAAVKESLTVEDPAATRAMDMPDSLAPGPTADADADAGDGAEPAETALAMPRKRRVSRAAAAMARPEDGPAAQAVPEATAASGEVRFQRAAPDDEAARLGRARSALSELAKHDELFQLPRPEGRAVTDIASEIDPAIRVKEARPGAQWDITMPDGAVGVLRKDRDGKLYLDASRLSSGVSQGHKLYAIASAYAHNNGLVFKGDPNGLSRMAMIRRTENMLSSALKYGTTRHLEPHPGQNIDWDPADEAGNLERLLAASYRNASEGWRTANYPAIPGLENITFNFDSGRFEYLDTGTEVTHDDFERIARTHRGLPPRYNPRRGESPAVAGSATVKRAALIRTLLRAEGGQIPGGRRGGSGDALLAAAARQRGAERLEAELPSDLRDIFYRRAGAAGENSSPPATPAADPSATEALNQGLARRFGDPAWEHAYVQQDLPDSLAEFAEAARAAFGAEVIGITATDERFDQFNGVHYQGRNFVNLNANVGFVNVAGHEIWHQLKKDRPDLHRWFAQQARAHYRNFGEYQDRLNALVGLDEAPYSKDAAEEELLADFAGDALADPAFVQRLAKAGPGRFRRLLSAVVSWLRGVAGKLRQAGLGSSHYFHDVETLRGFLAEALVAYAQGGPVAVGRVATPAFSRRGGTIADMTSSERPQQAEAEDGAVEGTITVPRASWRDFPDVYIHANEVAVKQHPSYKAAKTGDGPSAAQLVNDFLDDALVEQARSLAGSSRPIIVSVHAMERGGINAIPEALADALAVKLGLPVDGGIVQTNIVSHTSADGFSRIARQALFDGDVQSGADYLIVDDFVGQGGTLANLRGYIESKEGRVVGAIALAGRPYSARLRPTNEQLSALREKHGQLENWWRQRFGFDFDALTESEARYLQRTPDADKIRDRITSAQQAAAGARDHAPDQAVDDTPRRNAGNIRRAGDDIRFARRRPPRDDAADLSKPASSDLPAWAGDPEQVFAPIDAAIRQGGGWSGLKGELEKTWHEMSGTARRQALGALTVRQLVELGETVLPRLPDYLKSMTGMAVTRNQVLHEVDAIAKDWEALDKSTLGRLALVMHESTLAGVDGAETYTPSIDVKEAGKRIGILRRRQLEAPGDHNISAWQAEIRDLRRQVAFEQRRREAYHRIRALFQALPAPARDIYRRARDYHVAQSKRVEQALVEMIEKTHMTGRSRAAAVEKLRVEFEAQRVNAPYFPLSRQGDYWVSLRPPRQPGERVLPDEFHLFQTLEEQQAFIKDSQAAGLTILGRGKQLENLQEALGVPGSFVAQVEGILADLPDSPLVDAARDQVYQLYLTTLPDLSARRHFIHRKKTPGFGQDALRAFAHKGYHDAYQYARVKHGFELRAVMEKLREDLDTATSKPKMAALKRRRDWLEEFRDEVLHGGMDYSSVVERANSMSLQAMEVGAQAGKRRLTEGERFVGEEQKKWAQFVAWMDEWKRYGGIPDRHRQELADIERRIEASRRLNSRERGYELAADVYNELQQAYAWLMNPRTAPWATAANQLGYLWNLAFSPSAWLTNATQNPLIAMPYVASRHGVAATGKAFTQAYQEAFRGALQWRSGKEHRLGLYEALSDPDERQAYEQALEAGIIDRGRALDLAGVAEEGQARAGWHRKFALAMTVGFHDVERLNRETTFMAAYRLARRAGDDAPAAVDYASQVVHKTHFDYASENRPRVMRPDVARVMFQFKLYSQGVTYLLGRAVLDSVGKHATAAEKAEARKFLALQSGLQAAAAGALGLPIGLAWWAAQAAFAALFDDDDDPRELEAEFRQALAELLGQTGGEAVAKGLVNALSPIDLHSRVGMRELWFREADREVEGRDAASQLIGNAMGPMAGIVENLAVGAQLIGEGHVYRGIEKMAPKVLRDLLKSGRYASEGAQTLKGDPLVEDLTAGELLGQALGFTPARLGERYDENNATMNREKRIEDRRKDITGRLAQSRIDAAKAQQAGDADTYAKAQARFEEALAQARRFNEKNPAAGITGKTVGRSIQSRVRARAMAQHGIFPNRKVPDAYDFATE